MSRMKREFVYSKKLHKLGIHTIEIVKFHEVKKFGILPTDLGYTKSRYIENLTPLHLLVKCNNFKFLLNQAIEIIAKLHNARITHGDLSLSNFAVSNNQKVYLLDLETAEFVFFRFLACREIIRFIDDLIKELQSIKSNSEILNIANYTLSSYLQKVRINKLYSKYLIRLFKNQVTKRIPK